MQAARALLLAVACAAALLWPAAAGPARAGEHAVTVFAAASLRTALDEIATTWEDATGGHVARSYAGSSVLARQIQLGAPADLFISASPDWMDFLEAGGLIAPGTRRDLLGNSLVLIGHGPGRAPIAGGIGPELDLAGLLGPEGRLAMALVEAVPAGVYGKAALESLGLWETVAPRVAQTDNVRAALALVATGEAPLGIVYATDAAAETSVSVLGTFPTGSHPPIVYPAALTAGAARSEAARAFLAYLSGPEARAAFALQGFTFLD